MCTSGTLNSCLLNMNLQLSFYNYNCSARYILFLTKNNKKTTPNYFYKKHKFHKKCFTVFP
ncbi:hypothetical protein APR43_19180 [Flavobacterium sp. NLM]|nr:hypothetical protein AKO67_05570 [Flavobacterium sp. VMW]OWU89318.1 hypothetical protein APR43_19180 [Flavobacterium sp. NLM]